MPCLTEAQSGLCARQSAHTWAGAGTTRGGNRTVASARVERDGRDARRRREGRTGVRRRRRRRTAGRPRARIGRRHVVTRAEGGREARAPDSRAAGSAGTPGAGSRRPWRPECLPTRSRGGRRTRAGVIVPVPNPRPVTGREAEFVRRRATIRRGGADANTTGTRRFEGSRTLEKDAPCWRSSSIETFRMGIQSLFLARDALSTPLSVGSMRATRYFALYALASVVRCSQPARLLIPHEPSARVSRQNGQGNVGRRDVVDTRPDRRRRGQGWHGASPGRFDRVRVFPRPRRFWHRKIALSLTPPPPVARRCPRKTSTRR